MNRRAVVASMVAFLPIPTGMQAAESPQNDPIAWLIKALSDGDSAGFDTFVTSDVVVPSDLVKGGVPFGFWIIELNARMQQRYSAFSLEIKSQFADDAWALAFVRMTVTSRDSGNEAEHDWHIAAELSGGKIQVLHISYWV